MKKLLGRKFISGFLALMMICTLLPVSAMADDSAIAQNSSVATQASEQTDASASASDSQDESTSAESATDENASAADEDAAAAEEKQDASGDDESADGTDTEAAADDQKSDESKSENNDASNSEEQEASIADEGDEGDEGSEIYWTSQLHIILSVSGDDPEYDRAFNVRITLSDKYINGKYGDVTFTNGVANISLSAGGKNQCDVVGVREGVQYSVEETGDYADYGYSVAYTSWGNTFVNGSGSYFYIKNTRNLLGNVTVTNSVNGYGSDPDKEFEYTVTAAKDGTAVSGTYGDVTFENGTASFSLKGGEEKHIRGLHNGTIYTVTQKSYEDEEYVTVPASYVRTGTVATNVTDEALFTNTKVYSGTLKVGTQVYETGSDTTKEFRYTVTLSDTNVNGQYGEMTFTNGVATFWLRSGETETANYLPYCDYTVTQADYTNEGYITTSTGTTGTLSKDQVAVASFSNSKFEYSSLTVKNSVITATGDPDVSFSYTIKLSETITANYGDMKFVNGVCTFTLKDGEEIKGTEFPNDIGYTVTQEAVDGYTTTSTGATGVFNGIDKTASFQNAGQNTGYLYVYNYVNGNDCDKEKAFEYTITLSNTKLSATFGDVAVVNGVGKFTLKDQESISITGLPENIGYTIEQVDYSSEGYSASNLTSSGKIYASAGRSAIFSNTKNTFGSITVKIALGGNAPHPTKSFGVRITLSDSNISGAYGDMMFYDGKSDIYYISAENPITASGIPNGVSYTVDQIDYSADGYTTTYPENRSGAVVGNETQTVEILNSRDATGDLTIKCELAGNDTDPNKSFLFKIDLNDTSLYVESNGQTIRNGIGYIYLKGGESFTYSGIPCGTHYTVTEWETYEWAVRDYAVTSTDSDGYIKEIFPAEAVFTNTRNDFGYLTITNTLIGSNVDPDEEFTFSVELSDTSVTGQHGDINFTDGKATVTLKGGQSATADLPDGITYTVDEVDYKGCVSTKTNASGTITRNATKTAAFTNTKDNAGSLEISVKVTGNDIDPTKGFNYTVRLEADNVDGTYSGITFKDREAVITLKDGESFAFNDLPSGIHVKVTQTKYTSEHYYADKYEVLGVLEDGKTVAADFVNTHNTYGTLKVMNIVSGSSVDEEKEYTYTITLSDTTITSEEADDYGDVRFRNGVGRFSIEGSGTVTIEDIPNGVTYTIVQDDYSASGYVTTKTNDTGTFIGDKTLSAKFTNVRDGVGSLVVTNTITDGDKNKKCEFTLAVGDDDIYGTYGDVSFRKGIATFTLASGESVTVEKLPAGLTYTVVEKDYTSENYNTTSTGEAGKIVAGETLTAAFETIYDKSKDDGGKGDDDQDDDSKSDDDSSKSDDDSSKTDDNTPQKRDHSSDNDRKSSASDKSSSSGSSSSSGTSSSTSKALAGSSTSSAASSVSKSTSTSSSSVKTGDETDMTMYLMALILAGVCIAGCIGIRRRKS